MINKDIKDKKVIVHIITKLELGGAQKVCLALFNQTKDSNTDTYLISGTEGILVKDIRNLKNKLLIKEFKREIKIAWIFKEIKSFIKIVRKLRELRKKYNNNIIVHTHSTKAGLVGRWAAFFAGIKTRVHTIHGYGFHKHQSKLAWLLTYLLELSTSFITNHFICVSQVDANKGIKLFPNFKKKYSIIRAAIDTENLNLYKPAINLKNNIKDKDIFIFGTTSCFKPAKNLIDLLKAFKLVNSQNRNTKLEIIGDGILSPDIENFIKSNNLEKVVKLHGWQTNIGSIINKWNCFVLSSLWEGLPCAVIEARVLKIPVISYDTGGIKEIIKNNKNGFLIKQKDWKDLANKMLQLNQDKKIYYNFSNYQDNLIDFRYSTMIEEHKILYAKLKY